MAIFKIKPFDRFARRNGIKDVELWSAARDILSGYFDADLGGGLFKQRVARPGQGRSGGFRTLIAHRTSEHVFFVFGFAKNERENIGELATRSWKRLAKELGSYSAAQIALSIANGEFVEIRGEET